LSTSPVNAKLRADFGVKSADLFSVASAALGHEAPEAQRIKFPIRHIAIDETTDRPAPFLCK